MSVRSSYSSAAGTFSSTTACQTSRSVPRSTSQSCFCFWDHIWYFSEQNERKRSCKSVPSGTILTKQIPLRRRRTSLSMLLRLAAQISPEFASPKGKEGRQIAEWLIEAHKGSCKCLIHYCHVKRKMLKVFSKALMIVSQLPFKCKLNQRQCSFAHGTRANLCVCVCECRTKIPRWHAWLWNRSTACCGSTWSGLSVRATLEHRGNRQLESIEYFPSNSLCYW